MERVGVIEHRGGRLAWRIGSGRTVEIEDIEVPNAVRRQKVGRQMVSMLLRECEREGVRTVYAFTRTSNGVAQAFYRELRFRPLPVWSFYKDEPLADGKEYSDAVLFVRDVGSQA